MKYAIILVILYTLTGVTRYSPMKIDIHYQEHKGSASISPPKVKRLNELRSLGVDVESFLDRLGYHESRGNYQAVNQFGYLGKYQFSKRTLASLVRLGELQASQHELDNFLYLPEVQERAIDALIRHNLKLLRRKGMLEHMGTNVKHIEITLEGMLAASHLLGTEAVRHYVVTGGSLRNYRVRGILVRKYDGNGTSIEDYLIKFNNIT